jgi:hypothetical protein
VGANHATETFGRGDREAARVEAFIGSIRFLEPEERNRLLIVATEILDNILAHSKPRPFSRVTARVRKGNDSGLSLVFWFRSPDFAAFAARAGGAVRPYYDPRSNRYRGLGLTMCRNLTRSIRLRHGGRVDSIIVRLA